MQHDSTTIDAPSADFSCTAQIRPVPQQDRHVRIPSPWHKVVKVPVFLTER
jgi:hypothetical protein